MEEDESIFEFHAKMCDIYNESYALRKIYSNKKLVRKVLGVLPKRFMSKVTSIKESRDIEALDLDELIGSLQNYELTLDRWYKGKKTKNSKSEKTNMGVAFILKEENLKEVDLFETFTDANLALLAKNYARFLKRNFKKSNFGNKENTSSKNPSGFNKHSQHHERNGKGIQCHECASFGHIQAECANTLKKKKMQKPYGDRTLIGYKLLYKQGHDLTIDEKLTSSSGFVTFGDGIKGEIMGQGDLNLSDVSLLTEVLLVEGLKANLISISHLCGADYDTKKDVTVGKVMLCAKGFAIRFWAEAVNIACYICNCVHLRIGTTQTSYELWKGKTPNLSHLHIFGCIYYILNDQDHLGKFNVQDTPETPRPPSSRDLLVSSENTTSTSADAPATEVTSKSQIISKDPDNTSHARLYMKGPPTWIQKAHPPAIVIGDPNATIVTRRKVLNVISFACYVSLVEPQNVIEALLDELWNNAM
uniref:Gag-pol polyprotein n=1 Tax=Cannabis sativa TaxID=3483 RepID=A0A803Q9P0_CANSA